MESNNLDILFELLMNIDIESLSNFCLTSKKIYCVGNDYHYWKERFRRYNISILTHILPNNINEWIKEYTIMMNIRIQ